MKAVEALERRVDKMEDSPTVRGRARQRKTICQTIKECHEPTISKA